MKRILLSLMVGSIVLLSVQRRAIASTFSIKQITSEIRRKVDFPILLPSEAVVEQYRFDQAETIYANTSTSDGGYEVSFNNRPGSVGNAAFRFSISAYPGKEIERMKADSDPKYRPTFSQVKLADGSQSLVTMWCGGTACWSTVQWKSSGILYRVAAKQRQSKTAIAIANSAVKAGDRSKASEKASIGDLSGVSLRQPLDELMVISNWQWYILGESRVPDFVAPKK